MDNTSMSVSINNDTDRLSLFKSRLSLAKRFCKKPHDAWKKWLGEYNIKEWNDTDNIRDKVRIGYVFRKAESELPAIFDDQPQLFIKGRYADAQAVVPIINSLYDYLWDLQNLEEKIEDAGLYFEVIGMGFISSPWVTKTKAVTDPKTGQVHQKPIIDNPVAETEDPFKLWFSPETKFAPIMNAKNCPYYIKEAPMTVEEVKSRWGVKVKADETLKIDEPDTDLTVEQDAQIVKDDMKRVTVYEYYGTLPEDFAKGIKDEAGNKVEWAYDTEYHAYFTSKKELKIEACPYPRYPLHVLGSYGFANEFFKFGDAKHLMPLIQEYELYRSMVLAHTRRMANPKPLVNTTANIDEEAFRDPRSGVIVKWTGNVPPAFLQPAHLGDEVVEGINLVKNDLEKQTGSFDLSNGNPSSTVKSPKGIQVYSEAADKNTAKKRKKVARFIRQILLFQFMQVAQYWKPEDAKILGVVTPDGPQKIQVDEQILQIISGVNQLYTLDIEVESLSLNRVQMKRDWLDLYNLANTDPYTFNRAEVAKSLLELGYQLKNADRFLNTPDQQQQVFEMLQKKPALSVRVVADASTPAGATLLQNEGLIADAQAVESVAPSNPALAGAMHPLNQGAPEPVIPGQPQVAPNAPTQTPVAAHAPMLPPQQPGQPGGGFQGPALPQVPQAAQGIPIPLNLQKGGK